MRKRVDVHAVEDVQSLKHGRPLAPEPGFVYLIAAIRQVGPDEVEPDDRPHVADVRVVVDGRPADIHRDPARILGHEFLLGECQRVVELHGHFHLRCIGDSAGDTGVTGDRYIPPSDIEGGSLRASLSAAPGHGLRARSHALARSHASGNRNEGLLFDRPPASRRVTARGGNPSRRHRHRNAEDTGLLRW